MSKTGLVFTKGKDSQIKISGASKNAAMPFGPDFNFEKMGIGGLDKVPFFLTLFS